MIGTERRLESHTAGRAAASAPEIPNLHSPIGVGEQLGHESLMLADSPGLQRSISQTLRGEILLHGGFVSEHEPTYGTTVGVVPVGA